MNLKAKPMRASDKSKGPWIENPAPLTEAERAEGLFRARKLCEWHSGRPLIEEPFEVWFYHEEEKEKKKANHRRAA